jgi:hypothetical protein
MQPFNEESLERWEHLIAEVAKTDIPLECVKKIIVKLNNKRHKTINLATMKRQGMDWDEIETVVNRILSDLGQDEYQVDFVVDAAAVAQIVQPATDKLLTKLK